MALTDKKTLEIILKLTDHLTSELKSSKDQIKKLENNLKGAKQAGNNLSTTLKKVASVVGFAFLAKQVYDVGKSIVQTTGNFEQWNIAFSVMLGSAKEARVLLGDIKKFAATTPFELPQVVEGSKRLLAYNIAAADIIPTFTTLGNIAAGVGTEKLPQLITAFGQVSAKGKLMGQELLQFTEAGVNLGGELQKAFGVSRASLEKMISAGKVGFEDVRKALFNLGGETGKFGGLMEAQSQTIQGIWSNISDTIIQAFLSIGNAALPQIRQVVSVMLERLTDVQRWFEANQEVLSQAFVNMFDAIIKVGEVLVDLGSFFYTYLIEPIKEFLKQPVGKWLSIFTTGVIGLTVAFSALAAINPLGWIAIGVAAGIIAFNYLKANWDEVKTFILDTIYNLRQVFVDFFKHVVGVAAKIGAVFVSVGKLIFQAITGQFSKVKESFTQLQKDIGQAKFSFSVTTARKNVTSNETTSTSTSSTEVVGGDSGLSDFEASLEKKRELQVAADAAAAERLAANQASELEAKKAHTATLLTNIENNNLVDIEKETAKLARLEQLRGNSATNQIKLEETIAKTKAKIQKARDAKERGATDKQLKALLKLKGKDNVDQAQLERAISDRKAEILVEHHAKVLLLQKKENDLKHKLVVKGLKDGLSAIATLLELGAEKYEAAAIALKAIRTGEAIINTYAAATNALATVPFPFNIAAVGTVVASGLAQLAKIYEVKFASGTVSVPGIGNQDTVSAKLTPGEMVVPKTFAEGIRSGDLALSKTSTNETTNDTNISINVSLEGANFYGNPPMELVKEIFTQAAEYIKAGLMPALP